MTIAEDFVLLAMAADGKPMIGSLELGCGTACAVLAELALAQRLDLTGSTAVVRDTRSTGEPVEDEVLARVCAHRPRKLKWWVQHLYRATGKEVPETLVHDGVMDEHRDRVLGLFPRVRRLPRDPSAAKVVGGRLVRILDTGVGAPGDVALLGVVHGSGLGRKLFPGIDAKTMEKRLDAAASGLDGLDAAVRDVIREMQAVLVTAATVAAVGAATSGA